MLSISSPRFKVLVSSVGIVMVSGLLLAACSTGTQVQNQTTINSVSPTPTLQSLDQSITTEGDNLQKLDQAATAVDKSFNDQAIDVN